MADMHLKFLFIFQNLVFQLSYDIYSKPFLQEIITIKKIGQTKFRF